MRLQASGAQVANNVFERASAGVRVEFDQAWLEGSLGLRDISLVNNTFVGVAGCTQANSCVAHVDADVVNFVVKDNIVKDAF